MREPWVEELFRGSDHAVTTERIADGVRNGERDGRVLFEFLIEREGHQAGAFLEVIDAVEDEL